MLTLRVLVFRSALVAGLLLVSGTASALDFAAGPLFGINLGDASAEAPIDAEIETEISTGFAFGARAEFGVTRPFSVLLEPQYLQRGAGYKADFAGITIEADKRMSYLELPILAKAKFGSMKAHAYAIAGPSLGFFLNGEVESEGRTEDAEDVSSFNVSGDVGLGGAFQVQEFIYLNADARYSHGFTDAIDREDENEWHNRDIRFQLGLLFHLTQ